jgi:hypothetical protein
MVALAVRCKALSNDLKPVMPAEWGKRFPVIRIFPRLAVERIEPPKAEARWDEEPERWDGMA